MIQYLLNMSAVWLFGIIVFDIFLRKENYHGYNRWYLLSILFTGLLFPLWSWDNDSVIYTIGASTVVEQTKVMKETIVAAATPKVLSWEDALLYIYLGGACIVAGRLIYEFMSIINLYRNGNKTRHDGYILISINKQLSPFSVFNNIFIYSPDNYSTDELAMIIAHEQQHAKRYHSIDLILVRVFQVVLWFHPLVYLIEKRLLMVHEYQADAAIRTDSNSYEKFLVEQSILGTAPILAHSFIRSPLKNRILMMTRKTTALGRYKKLIAIPVIMMTFMCCTQVAQSYEPPQKEGNKVTYNGNVIEFPDEMPPDTVMVEDPITGEIQMMVTRREPTPIKLNGEKIYSPSELRLRNTEEGYTNISSLSSNVLKMYLLNNMQEEIRSLDDGEYILDISDIVLSSEGKVVYFKFGGLNKVTSVNKFGSPFVEEYDEDAQKGIAKKIATLLKNSPKYDTGIYNGKNVHSAISNFDFRNTFKIEGGKLTEF